MTACALALAGCAKLAPAPASPPPGERWRMDVAALDSLGAADRVDEALARVRAELTPPPSTPWLLADLTARERSLARRAALAPARRAALAHADRVLLAAQRTMGDSLGALIAHARSAWSTRVELLGPDDLAAAEAALACGEAEAAVAHVAEADSFANAARHAFVELLGPDHPRVGDTDDLLGRIIKNFTGRVGFDAAQERYRSALRIREATEGPRSLRVAETLHNMANLFRLVERSDEAYRCFQHALAIRRERLGPVHDDVASTLGGMAFMRLGQGRYADAELLIRRALAATPPGQSIDTRSLRLGLLGQLIRRRGRDAEAVPILREAVALRESVWAGTPRDAGSSVIAGLGLYRDLALALERSGHPTEAFEQLERGSARTLASRLVEVKGADVWKDLVPRLQAALAGDEAVVVWPRTTTTSFVAEYPMAACIVRAQGPVQWLDLPRRTPVYPRFGTIREALWTELRAVASWPRRVTDTTAVDGMTRLMWHEWFEPLEPSLRGVRHLIVCSPDLVASGPLGVMRDAGGRYLADRFDISYTPSALLLLRSRTRPRLATWSRPALLVGDPAYPASDPGQWSRLAGTAEEIRDLAARLPTATLLTGADARADRLRAMAHDGTLARYGLVHFAAHAEIDPRRVLESSLVLAPDHPGGARSSRLVAREIAAGWRLDADLVCLAACRSVLGLSSATDGSLGLQQAFLAAGARSVLVTLWPVDDGAAALLMRTFYERLADRARPAGSSAALREAQRALRTWRAPDGSCPYAHPAYWGGFALIGDPG